MLKKTRLGFTLAEVLITLGIIGVVAAMTMPVLIAKHKEKEYVTKLKKFNSVMDQAIKMSIQQNGEIADWGLTNWSGGNPDQTEDEIAEGNRSKNAFWAKVLPQLKVSSFCEYGTTCNVPVWKRHSMDGTEFGTFKPVITLLDGSTIVSFTILNANCSTKSGSGALQYVCGELFVDLNGSKPPNATGKDVFMFYYTKFGVVPMGTAEQTSGFTFDNYCNMGKSSSLNGYGCTAWIMYNENMDYLRCDDLNWNDKLKCN